MKRVTTYIALMIAASLLTGCGKESIAYGEAKPLSFLSMSKNIKEKTRAEFKENGFGVVVYHSLDNDISSLKGNEQIFDNICNKKVVYKTAYWEIDELNKRYYWPDNGSLFFAAYAPYRVDAEAGNMPHNFSTPYRWVNYENNGADLQFADVQFLGVDTNAGSPVPIKFNHALSMVSVDVCVSSLTDGREIWDTTLKGVRLVNIRKKGNVTINNNEVSHNRWSTSTNDGVWETETAKDKEYETTLQITYPQPITLTSDPVHTLEEKIVIPQQLLQTGTDQQLLELNYKVKSTIHYIDPADGLYKEEIVNNEYTQSIPLYQNSLPKWEMGKHIKYTITINFNKPIEFEGSSNNWTDGLTFEN